MDDNQTKTDDLDCSSPYENSDPTPEFLFCSKELKAIEEQIHRLEMEQKEIHLKEQARLLKEIHDNDSSEQK